ncbi:MAG: DUF493 domain-containing protein [Proteobacteria bacterium]|nr:DUF493 domain-containing protein [Pseudomonadota bacterium]
MTNIKKTDEAPGLVFPCSINVKIFVKNHSDEEAIIREFVAEQLEAHHLTGWSSRESSGGKYLAISAKVDAQSREHIDGFYQALTGHQRVIMLI